MNALNFRLPSIPLSRRAKAGLGLFVFGLSGWVMAQSTGYYREPAARLRAPQPIRQSESGLVARGLTPEYTSFAPTLPPPTGRVSNPAATKPKQSSSSWSWVFGPSAAPPRYLFGSSNKSNPISTTAAKPVETNQERSSYIESAWTGMKNLVTGSPSPTEQPPSQPQRIPQSYPQSGFGLPTQPTPAVPAQPQYVQAQAPTAFRQFPNTGDTGVYAREPAYRWYGWGTTTPGTNPYAPSGRSPQGSANWYVQTGATPGAFPAPDVNTAQLEVSPDHPRYMGNTVIGGEVTVAPTIWMNVPPAREVVPPPLTNLPAALVQPSRSSAVSPAPSAPAGQPAPVLMPRPPEVTMPGPIVIPGPPSVDVVSGLLPQSRPTREPLPTVPVTAEQPTIIPVGVNPTPAATNSSPQSIVPQPASAVTQPQTLWAAPSRVSSPAPEPSRVNPVPSNLAQQAPARSAPVNAMPPMPYFPAGSVAQPAVSPPARSQPLQTEWVPATPRPSNSSVSNRPGPPPPFQSQSVSTAPAPEAASQVPGPTVAKSVAGGRGDAILPANWKEPAPIARPTQASASQPLPAIQVNTGRSELEQQIRDACYGWVKIVEVRQPQPKEYIISFTATSESDARAAAQAVSKLAGLRPYTVSFNAQIVSK